MRIIKPVILFLLLCLAVSSTRGQARPASKNLADTLPIKVDSLKAAIVTAALRPHMKGDTLEYNTEHMQMPPNALVEELLRRLPGLQIDPKGGITYNGEKIQHLLVDGEDIFGSDPSMVTRNFDASKIGRVQILDRKSEQTIFTGIDDGSRTKTLNLVMKESAKNGYFGKVEGGGDVEGNYLAEGVLAGFRRKEQFTALGLASNMGETGFSDDGSAGNIQFLNGSADELGASAGSGIPHFGALAVHYANSWSRPDEHIMSNYQYSHFLTKPVTNTQSYQTEKDSIYGQRQQSQSTNQQDQHWVYGVYNVSINPRSAFELGFNGTENKGQNQFGSMGNSTFNDTLVNSSNRSIQDQVNGQNVGMNLSWRTGMGKRSDRVFSMNIGVRKIDGSTKGYLYSINRFYEPGGQIESTDTVDERKLIISHSVNLIGGFSFAEPLWKGAILGLSYRNSIANEDPLQSTFNRGDGQYEDLVDSLSSHLSTRTINQRTSISLQGKTRGLNYILGNEWVDNSYRQQDLIADSVIRLHYFNWAPKIRLTYTTTASTNYVFTYNSFTQEPSIAQLAPVKNNNDPLSIVLGNPGLKPALSQSFSLQFHRFKNWGINLSLNMSLTNNTISNKTITDSLGRQISQPVNVSGGMTGGSNFSLFKKIAGFDAGFHVAGTFSRTINYINMDLNRNDAYNVGAGFSLEKYVANKYFFQFNTNLGYFDQVSSINLSTPICYLTQSHTGVVTIYLIKDFQISTNASYNWQGKSSVFSTATSVLLCNSAVSRNFIHNKLVVKGQFNNMFNQNAGISRSNVNNMNTQSNTNILSRYWMISATYHFDKKFRQK